MKQLFEIIFILIINTVCLNKALAQTSSFDAKSTDLNQINIPPLEVIMDSVINRNAMVRFRKKEIEAKEYHLKSERVYWTRNIGVQADTRYGTLDNYTTNIDALSRANFSTITNKQFTYTVGLYLKLPLFDVVNRKNQVRMATVELEAARSMAEFQEDEVKETVITQYQDLILKQRLLYLKSQNLGDARVNMEMVEKEFRNGIIAIGEYVRISDMTSRIESDYEVAKSNFLLSKQLLENIAGFTIGVNY